MNFKTEGVLLLFYLSCHVGKLVLCFSSMKTISWLPPAVSLVSLRPIAAEIPTIDNFIDEKILLAPKSLTLTKFYIKFFYLIKTAISLQMSTFMILILAHFLKDLSAAFLQKAVPNPFLRVIS